MAIGAMVLAGSANTGPLRECSPAPNEALIEIGGKPMIQYVIDGLMQSGRVGKIVVVSPPGQLEPHVRGDVEFVPAQEHVMDNIVAASRVLPKDSKVLIATCDIPLITGAIVSGFLDLCRQNRYEADLHYPIVEKRVSEAKYPQARRTYVHLKDGVFTGGNLFLCNPRKIEEAAPRVRRFIDNRKSPLRLAGLLGWSFVIRFFLRTCTLKELEAKVSQLWGIDGCVVNCPYPEVGLDVDKPSDLQLARAALAT